MDVRVHRITSYHSSTDVYSLDSKPPAPLPSILSGTTQDRTKDAVDHDRYQLTSHDSEIYTTPNTLPRRKYSNKGGATDYLDEDDEYVDISPRRAYQLCLLLHRKRHLACTGTLRMMLWNIQSKMMYSSLSI